MCFLKNGPELNFNLVPVLRCYRTSYKLKTRKNIPLSFQSDNLLFYFTSQVCTINLVIKQSTPSEERFVELGNGPLYVNSRKYSWRVD